MNTEIRIKKHLIVKRIIFLIMLVCTFYVIFNFSAQDGEKSSSVSNKVTTFIVEVTSKVKNMDTGLKTYYIEKLEPIVRKLAHFSIYMVIGFSVMGFMCTFNIRNAYKFLASFSIGVVYAISDEIHQAFTPGRSPRILDVCIDSAGVLTGIFILIFLIIICESIVNWFKR